ncbi:MAG: class I tRNA ligase family protein [Patescibacteria group bacterium]|nr:class I tRNA ligase family protein [Patescibacteria group bacterium]MDD5491017.1 class I tRNA ligase family protein [Patescibacteria group bacterium]
MFPRYNFKKIEKKWQKQWESDGIYHSTQDFNKKKFYSLIEFPYPSGQGLHVGHPRSYTAMDLISRKKRMEGFNVLYPIGWDAFGLPAENYAIKTGIHPAKATAANIKTFKKQIKSLGLSFDWSREINTTDPAYYKWTQWMFLQLFKHGLAYKTKIAINWCKNCKIGLANEEVVNGKCERCGGEVEKREKEQWMIKITKYAQRLLDDLDKVDYLPQIKEQQKNWIGRSEGALIDFGLRTTADRLREDAVVSSRKAVDKIKVFTTRPDTLFGATYMVLSPEHGIIKNLESSITNYAEVRKYIEQAKRKSDLERTELQKEKTGVEIKGIKAINPVNGEELPIWVADYVLASYGTGTIMAVPAHDERDFEFAKKYSLPIKTVVTTRKDNIVGVGAMIEIRGGKFLFQRRDKNTDRNPGMLAFFGGGIENNEDTEEALKREIKEELNLEVKDNFVLLNKLESHNFPGKYLDIFYVKNIDEKNIKLSEGDAIKKLDLSEALARTDVTPFTKNVIKYLLEKKCFTEEGISEHSDFLNGLSTPEAKGKMINWLEEKGVGKRAINYKLRDWVFSRQRYWGEPIPLVHCEKCAHSTSSGQGWIPVPEKDLPVKLPKVKKYEPTDTGESPLATIEKWVNVKCPKCGGAAKRETDTMPNWAGSSWYFLRYTDPANDKEFANRENLKYWMTACPASQNKCSEVGGVDWYNGGMEHVTLHLLYSRFWYKFLYDIGAIPKECGDEPYKKRTSQGMILGEGGEKMSKSRGNVINPDDVVKEHGADTFRVYEMFMGPFDQAIPWDTQGVIGCRRFLERVWRLQEKITKNVIPIPSSRDEEFGSDPSVVPSARDSLKDDNLKKLLHKTIKKVTEDIEEMKFNTAISQMMILVNEMEKQEKIPSIYYSKLLILLAPFAPHITEELWQKVGPASAEATAGKNKKSIHLEKWPEPNLELIKDTEIILVIQVNGKVRDNITVPADISEKEAKKLALESEKIRKFVPGEPKKVIFVPGKLINIVT